MWGLYSAGPLANDFSHNRARLVPLRRSPLRNVRRSAGFPKNDGGVVSFFEPCLSAAGGAGGGEDERRLVGIAGAFVRLGERDAKRFVGVLEWSHDSKRLRLDAGSQPFPLGSGFRFLTAASLGISGHLHASNNSHFFKHFSTAARTKYCK